MRKTIPMLLIAVAAVVACQKQNTETQEFAQSGTYVYTLNASVETTKTDYDASGHFSWSAGDGISVLFHNGDVNKFFTLTTSGTGKTASFSGTIDEGYTIGASDGTAEDKKIWALFPASDNHSYTAGSNPTFYVQPEWDFTAPGAHYSANIPMYALVAAEGANLTFANLASTYKFVVSNIDNSITRVKFAIYNQKTYGLSGSWSISGSDDDKYIDFGYASPATAKSYLTLTSNVTDHTAIFYIPSRYWGKIQPSITISNADNGYILKQLVGSKEVQPTSKTEVQPVSISAPGTGNAFISTYGIDWGNVTASANGSADPDGIKTIKASADASKVYLYLEIKTSALYDNAGYSHANKACFYLSNGTGTASSWTQPYTEKNSEDWLKINNVTVLDEWDDLIESKNIYINDVLGLTFIEIALNRSYNACLQGTTAYLAVDINTQYVEGGAWKGSSSTKIGYAPAAGGDMLAVTCPTYVAP